MIKRWNRQHITIVLSWYNWTFGVYMYKGLYRNKPYRLYGIDLGPLEIHTRSPYTAPWTRSGD